MTNQAHAQSGEYPRLATNFLSFLYPSIIIKIGKTIIKYPILKKNSNIYFFCAAIVSAILLFAKSGP